VRERIEAALERLGHLCFRHAWPILIGFAIVLGLGASQIPSIEIRTSMDEFLQRGDPTKAAYDAFLARFGRDDMILLAIEPEDVFDPAFLERLRDFHEALEDEVPHLREVQSLITARETRGVDDGLIVGELFEDWPETPGELAAIRERALANPLYVDFILSRDARLTLVTVELEAFSVEQGDLLAGFDDDLGAGAGAGADPAAAKEARHLTGAQEAASVAAIESVVERFSDPDFPIHAGGAPVLNVRMMVSLVTNILVFTALSTVMIAFFLVVVLRRALGVFIPLGVSILSVVGTLGLMGSLGIPAMPISEIVPSFLLSVGVGASVHLIVIFLQRFEAGASREDAIAGALGHSGLPIIMTSLTTAGGLASFAAADLLPVAIFGVVSPLGLLVVLVLTLSLTPALLAVAPIRATTGTPTKVTTTETGDRVPDALSVRMLTRLGAYATRRPGVVIGASVAMVFVAIVGMLRLEVSFDNLEWFPDDLPAKIATRTLDEKFGGSMALEMLVVTPEPNGLQDPAVLAAMDRARQTIEGLQVGAVVAGRSVSLVDVVKEIHQALNEGRPEARVVPRDRALIAQELILFENSGSDDLEDVVDTTFEVGRFTIRVPMVDALHYPPFGEEVSRLFEEVLPGDVVAQQTGMMMVMGRTFVATIETMFRSYTIALLVITPLMMLLLGSFRLGLIAMIPNLFPIVLTLGLMGWTGQPLEMFSLLIGSVALGLAVDDTIHFMHGFRRRYARTGSVEQSVRETLQTTGQALLFTSVVLAFGFLIYVFSDLNNLTRFGAFTAFSIAMAFFADVLLAPALMKVTIAFSSLRTAVDPHGGAAGRTDEAGSTA
jgi:predicted RND superfamily exporter protein